jgi:hypothetical protein
MQALGPRDINRAADPFPQKHPEKPQAEGSNARVKRKRNEAHADYTSTERAYPSYPYSEAAREQLVIDFPMFYKTE